MKPDETITLRVLQFVGSHLDEDLVVRELRKSGIDFEPHIARTQEEFERELIGFCPDISLIVSSIPGLKLAEALSVAEKLCPGTPVLVVVDFNDEETAVYLKSDRVDFVMKRDLSVLFPPLFKRLGSEVGERRCRLLGEMVLEQIGKVARIGGWELDLRTMTPRWTSQTRRLHEVSNEYIPTLKKALGFYPVEARPLLKKAIDQAITHGEPFDLNVPFITGKGRPLWVRVVGKADMSCGKTSRLYGTFQDISEHKKTLDALNTSERLGRSHAEFLKQALEAVAMESQAERVAEHFLRATVRQLGAHSSSIWMRQDSNDLIEFEYGFEGEKFTTRNEETSYGNSLPLRFGRFYRRPKTFSTEKSYMLEDITAGIDFPWRMHLLKQGVQTLLKVPAILSGKVVGVMGIRFDVKRDLQPEEMDLAQNLANQAILSLRLNRLSAQHSENAVLEERNRMAREIHDTLAQGFTGVIMQLEASEEAISQNRMTNATECITRAADLARESLSEARRSVRALRPLALNNRGLGEALKHLIENMTKNTSVNSTFTIQGEQREVPSEWESHLLRIGQEALTNAFRHSRGNEFHALLVFGEREIRLEFKDNGVGFDATAQKEGFGLRGMQERVAFIGGRLSIQSNCGEGTRIAIVLPLKCQT